MSIGDAIDQEDNYDKLEREINNIKEVSVVPTG